MAAPDSSTPTPSPTSTAQGAAPLVPSKQGNPARKKTLTAVAAVVVVADNAYVQGNVVQLTPRVGGTVIAINADDTDHVKAGQLLVRLDPAGAQVALDQAEAQLAKTVREVRTLYANNGALKAQIALRGADVARVQNDLVRAQDDVARRAPLVATGAVAKEEFNHVSAQLIAARSSVTAAQSATLAAREQLASNQTLTDGITLELHPSVLRAAAKVREAYPALKARRPTSASGRVCCQAQRATRPTRASGHTVDVGHRAQSGVGRGQFQRKAVAEFAPGTAGGIDRRCVR